MQYLQEKTFSCYWDSLILKTLFSHWTGYQIFKFVIWFLSCSCSFKLNTGERVHREIITRSTLLLCWCQYYQKHVSSENCKTSSLIPWHWSFSIPPKNIKKVGVFWTSEKQGFSDVFRDIENYQWHKMGQRLSCILYDLTK